jgi:hypothetical protein
LNLSHPQPAKPVGQAGGKTRTNLTVWVALFFLLVWVLFTHSHVGSFNDRSRMAAIESRVTRGTWIIDESPFNRTVDRIYVDGHFYSDKPPVLSFVASGVYTVLHGGFGLSLDAGRCDFDEGPCHCRVLCDEKPDWAYYLLTLTLIGLPSALMLALFYHMTGLLDLDNPAALLLTGTLGLATQVFPYSTVFNSHVPATACLLAGFYALLRWQGAAGDKARAYRWQFVSGLMTALACTCDLGVGLFFVAFFVYMAWENLVQADGLVLGRRHTHTSQTAPDTRTDARSIEAELVLGVPMSALSAGPITLGSVLGYVPWPYLIGGLLPIALAALLDYQIIGSLLPPYMHTQGYDYPGSRFPQTIAGNRSPENVLSYGLRLLVGDHGLFAFSPVLLWAVGALVQAWRDGSGATDLTGFGTDVPIRPVRSSAAMIGLTAGLFALYFILFTDNFGGAAYGPRWYTVFTPLVFLFVAARWRSPNRFDEPGAWVRLTLFLALAALSFANSYQGALNPWRAIAPVLHVEYAPSVQREPVDMALSGVVFEEIEPDLLATFATRRVDKRWFDACSCLVIPPGPTWLFIDPGRPLDPALAERSGLAQGGNVACYVNLRPMWETYRGQMATSAWFLPAGASLPPAGEEPREDMPLPVDFGGQLALVGYELLPRTAGLPAQFLYKSSAATSAGDRNQVSRGDELGLITAWQIVRELDSPLAIFVHLLDSEGRISGQHDGLGVDPYSLRAGDVVLQVHRFAVEEEALPGPYWLQVGLYNPETMNRLPVLVNGTPVADRILLETVHVEDVP